MLIRTPNKFSALGNFASLMDLDEDLNIIVEAINNLYKTRLSVVDVIDDPNTVQNIKSYYCIGENGTLVQMPLVLSALLSQEAIGSFIHVSSNMIKNEAIQSQHISNACINQRHLSPGCLQSQHFADKCLDASCFKDIQIDGSLINRIQNLTSDNFEPNAIPTECLPQLTMDKIDATYLLPHIFTLDKLSWEQKITQEQNITDLTDIIPTISKDYNNWLKQNSQILLTMYINTIDNMQNMYSHFREVDNIWVTNTTINTLISNLDFSPLMIYTTEIIDALLDKVKLQGCNNNNEEDEEDEEKDEEKDD